SQGPAWTSESPTTRSRGDSTYAETWSTRWAGASRSLLTSVRSGSHSSCRLPPETETGGAVPSAPAGAGVGLRSSGVRFRRASGRSTARLQPDCALTGPQDLRYVEPAGRHTASQNRASERPARAPDKPWLGAPAMGRSGSVTEAVSGLRRTKALTLSELRLSVG